MVFAFCHILSTSVASYMSPFADTYDEARALLPKALNEDNIVLSNQAWSWETEARDSALDFR